MPTRVQARAKAERSAAPRKPRAPRTTPKAVEARQLVVGPQLLSKVASGMSVAKAAQELGLSRAVGYQTYLAELQASADINDRLRSQLVEVDLETLRMMTSAYMPGVMRGDPAAGRVMLGVLAHRANLLGLNSEVKIRISNEAVRDTVSHVVQMIQEGDAAPGSAMLPIEEARRG